MKQMDSVMEELEELENMIITQRKRGKQLASDIERAKSVRRRKMILEIGRVAEEAGLLKGDFINYKEMYLLFVMHKDELTKRRR